VEGSFYLDVDGDGYGNPNIVVYGCDAPAGYVSDASDCDDTRSDLYLCDADEDIDGDGYSANEGDCDETKVAISPIAVDLVGDWVDQNCDGVDGFDGDGDGAASGVTGGEDCDDTDADVSPFVAEDCTTGQDVDCDGVSVCDEAQPADCQAPDAWYGGLDTVQDLIISLAYPLAYDSGLVTSFNQSPLTTGTVVPPVPIGIEEATVLAVGDGSGRLDGVSSLWVGDGKLGMQVFLDFESDAPAAPMLQPGDFVSFTAVTLRNEEGQRVIQRAEDWFTGGAPNDISVQQDAFETLDYAQDGASLVQVAGAVMGLAETCGGGHRCWRVVTPLGDEISVRVRHDVGAATTLEVGRCLEVLAPQSGYMTPDGTLGTRLEVDSQDWLRTWHPDEL
jgi:hypothetical protein